MFCRKKKNKNDGMGSDVLVQKRGAKNTYVEIRQLAHEFSALSADAHEINAILVDEKISNTSLSFYQQSIRRAFIDDFERRFEELFDKKMSFAEYWKSRSC